MIKLSLELTKYAHPTILKTGGGYHIILPFDSPLVLENINEFQKYEQDKPSQEFLRYTKDFLSDDKADKQNYPSFKSCLLRIPGSINSNHDKKVTIVQKWNGYRPKPSLELLLDFRIYLRQKINSKIFVISKIKNKKRNNNHVDYTDYE